MLYLVAPLVAPIIGFAMAKSTTELAYLTVKNLKPKDAPYEVVEGTSEYTKRGAGRLLIRGVRRSVCHEGTERSAAPATGILDDSCIGHPDNAVCFASW